MVTAKVHKADLAVVVGIAMGGLRPIWKMDRCDEPHAYASNAWWVHIFLRVFNLC